MQNSIDVLASFIHFEDRSEFLFELAPLLFEGPLTAEMRTVLKCNGAAGDGLSFIEVREEEGGHARVWVESTPPPQRYGSRSC